MSNKIKDTIINLRVSSEMATMIKKLSITYGLSQSDLLREIIKNEYDKNKSFMEYERANKEDK